MQVSESLGCPFVAEANLPYPVRGIWSGEPPPHVTPTPPFLLWSPRLPLPISSHVNKLLFPCILPLTFGPFPLPFYGFRCLTLFLVLSLVRWLLFTSFLVSSDFLSKIKDVFRNCFKNNSCSLKEDFLIFNYLKLGILLFILNKL